MNSSLNNKVTAVINKLDELYDKRDVCIQARKLDNTGAREIRIMEGEYDVYLKRTVLQLEQMLRDIAQDSL